MAKLRIASLEVWMGPHFGMYGEEQSVTLLGRACKSRQGSVTWERPIIELSVECMGLREKTC